MTSPEVTYLTLEEAPQKLWLEWIGSYFDGNSHEIGPSGTGSVPFPRASVSFDQAQIDQPLEHGLNILVLAQTIGSHSSLREQGKWIVNDMRWNFYVRSASAEQGKGNPQYQCRLATQLLRACLSNDYATKGLAEKGIYDLEVKESEPIESQLYQLRRLRVTGRMEYEFRTK